MTKKLGFMLLASLLIASLIAPGAIAAMSDQQQKNIEEIHQKIDAYQKQLVDEYLAAGLITEEQAAFQKERLELRAQYRNEYNGPGLGRGGFGMRVGGFGMGRGMGFGGPCMQYYPSSPVN